ncbi:MAG: hypothetical protein R3D26_24065 [Cyanobacteriota/Melainabacteria group bacterium]
MDSPRNTPAEKTSKKIVNYNDYRARQKALVPDAYELLTSTENFDSIDTNGDNRGYSGELGKAISNAPDAES